MSRFRMRKLPIVALFAISVQVSATGIPVVDIANLLQSIQQVLADSTKISHMVSQIGNQVRQINQMREQLKSIGNSQYGSIINDLLGQYQEVRGVLGSISSISYSVRQIKSDFDSLFPDASSWNTYDYGNYGGLLDQWNNEVSMAAQEAMQAQSVVSRINENTSKVRALLNQSMSAEGDVRQMQLLNQNSAVLSRQLSDVSQLLAANGRMEAMRVAREEKEYEATRRYLRGMRHNYGGMTLKTAVHNSLVYPR